MYDLAQDITRTMTHNKVGVLALVAGKVPRLWACRYPSFIHAMGAVLGKLMGVSSTQGRIEVENMLMSHSRMTLEQVHNHVRNIETLRSLL